jgi:hypothetical protein
MAVRPDPVHGLALAVVASATSPLILLNGDLTVVGASATFFRAFHVEPSTAVGLPIFDLGDGEWNVRQLRS